jgi:hypothetical protein
MKKHTLIAVVLCFFGGAARGDDAPSPPIRQFDIATIEKLGRAMYRFDQDAWKGTDILVAAHPHEELTAQKLRGWIVVSRGDADVVRFVHEGPNGPELFYDVTFPNTGPPVLTVPADRTLAGGERAMYNARTLALGDADRKCSDTYNTVVLNDPEHDGWLVWVMAATKSDRDAVILGGHTRFTISADGSTIRQKDVLSHTCQRYSRAKGPNGENAEIISTQVVSQVPVETYVFASLSYKMTIRVGTNDGKAWKIEGGNLTNIDMDMPGVDGFAARTLASYEENCMALAKKSSDQKSHTVSLKSVIEATEHGEKYVPEALAPGESIAAIMCGRVDIVPAPNDYKVLRAGYPLYISDIGVGHPKNVSALELSDGRFRFRNVDGKLPAPDVLARVQKRLDQLQTAFQK